MTIFGKYKTGFFRGENKNKTMSQRPERSPSIRMIKKALKKRLFQWSIPGIAAVNHSPIKLNTSIAPRMIKIKKPLQLITLPHLPPNTECAAFLTALLLPPELEA